MKDDYQGKQWGHSLSAWYLLGGPDSAPAAIPEKTAAKLRKFLLAEQSKEGNWKAAQQFGNQRRPKTDADEVQTRGN